MFINFFKRFNFPNLWKRIFNRYNFTKVIIIFTIGFISRIIIFTTLNINVLLESTNYISIIYYFILSCFIILVHEFVDYFNFSIIPNFIIDYKANISNINFKCLNLSSIKKKIIFNKIKLTSFDFNLKNNVLKNNFLKTYVTRNGINTTNCVNNVDNTN